MYRSFTVSTAPASEPVTTAEAKTHLRVSGSDEDTYIDSLVTSARQWVELYTGLALITQTITEKWDDFPCEREAIPLRIAPVIGSLSITYKATDGTNTTWSSSEYLTSLAMPEPIIAPAQGYYYPTPIAEIAAVSIQYSAGYGAASAVPKAIKQAILLLVGDMYEQRQDTVKQLPTAAERLLQPFKREIAWQKAI